MQANQRDPAYLWDMLDAARKRANALARQRRRSKGDQDGPSQDSHEWTVTEYHC